MKEEREGGEGVGGWLLLGVVSMYGGYSSFTGRAGGGDRILSLIYKNLI